MAYLTDEDLARLLKYDFSKGHEKFKEELLAKCLARGRAGEEETAVESHAPILRLVDEPGGYELADDELDAVAGGTSPQAPQDGDPGFPSTRS